jgi:16S rRNA (adenine1518-N6/adenine1519-N6)-dimethyltransferase
MSGERRQAPRKRFGQNFLTDPMVARRIVEACGLREDEAVLEIGPGRGALTEHLLERVRVLHAIELDRDIEAALRERWPALRLTGADALRVDYRAFFGERAYTGEGRWTVVGNLPYNISTPLLMRLLPHAAAMRQMVFMLQQEVVDRMCAAPGTKAWGRLSVMVGYHCRADALFGVAPGSFFPVPKVRSRIVRLVPTHPAPMPPAMPEVVRRAFSQRRKTLRNALSGCVSPEQMLALQVDPGRRPDTLSIAEFVRLSAVARVSAARAPDAGVDADQDDDDDDDEDLTPRSQGDHE